MATASRLEPLSGTCTLTLKPPFLPFHRQVRQVHPRVQDRAQVSPLREVQAGDHLQQLPPAAQVRARVLRDARQDRRAPLLWKCVTARIPSHARHRSTESGEEPSTNADAVTATRLDRSRARSGARSARNRFLGFARLGPSPSIFAAAATTLFGVCPETDLRVASRFVFPFLPNRQRGPRHVVRSLLPRVLHVHHRPRRLGHHQGHAGGVSGARARTRESASSMGAEVAHERPRL